MKVTNIYFPTWQFCWWPFLGWLPFQSLSKLQIRGSEGHGLNHLQGHLHNNSHTLSLTHGRNQPDIAGFPRLSSTNCFIFLPIALGTAWVARHQCWLPVHTRKHIFFWVDFFWKAKTSIHLEGTNFDPTTDSFTEIPPVLRRFWVPRTMADMAGVRTWFASFTEGAIFMENSDYFELRLNETWNLKHMSTLAKLVSNNLRFSECHSLNRNSMSLTWWPRCILHRNDCVDIAKKGKTWAMICWASLQENSWAITDIGKDIAC